MIQRILLFSLAFIVVVPSASAKLEKELEDQVYSVLERANRSGDAKTRALATEAFGPLRPEETKAYAVDALKDPVFEVRAAAVVALIKMKEAAFAPVLYNEMANPRRVWSTQIMPMLAMLSDKDAVALAHKLMADERAATKNKAIEAFGALGGKRMLAFYVPLMKGKDKTLAEGVQNYVLSLRTAEMLPLYKQILAKGTPPMQARALESLAEFPKGVKLDFVRKLLKSKD
ncbi:MAG: HEAT repeat protein, partial [Myxococcota bacterium]